MEKGRHEESLRLVSRLLRRRLGPLPEAVETRLRGLSLNRLEALAEALLDFSSLADLKAWLRAT
ncbi:MAG: DUF4351 domain-containing protein [Pedosphaera sp.]|nr:DUF4351 domain-containing protein [Pedosphaera sp.]